MFEEAMNALEDASKPAELVGGLQGTLDPVAPTIGKARGADGSGDAPLDLVRRLCEALSAQGIAYCHWKSNDALDRSARGDNDLDLLVSRGDAQRFAEIIRRLGFKDARPPSRKQVPGVFHSYGLDEASGKLVHIHGHYQLVLGDDMTKNYRLPIEDAYLASAEQGSLFRVPAVEFEFVVFVVRMVLKHSTLDAILSRQGWISPGEARELEFLTNRAEEERARAVLREHVPFIDEALWDRCVRCLHRRTSLWFRIRTAHRLEHSLAAHARRPPGSDALLRLWRRGRVTFRRRILHRPSPRSRLEGGGALIAVVGGDGAGKSTAVDELYRWLSKEFVTVKVHLGKPPWSLTSSVVQGVWRGSVRGFLHRSSASRTAALAVSDGGSLSSRAFLKLIRRIMTSRDRYLAYVRSRRSVSDGAIVVADRFPLPEIELMDGPATARLLDTPRRNRIVRYLARLEKRYYERILYPDILIVLRVDPSLAVERKQGAEDEDFVRRRSEEIWHLDWGRLPAIVIDAGRPKDDVLAEIKSAIWSRL